MDLRTEMPLVKTLLTGDIAIDYECINSIEVVTEVNHHSYATISVLLRTVPNFDELIDKTFKLITEESGIIFCGTCYNYAKNEQNQYCTLTLHLVSLSKNMDRLTLNCSYQSPSKTLGFLFNLYVSRYGGFVNVSDDVVIDRVLSQKNETDWSFLIRVANQEGKSVFINSRKERISLNVGSDAFRFFSIEEGSRLISVEKDFNELRVTAQNGCENQPGYEFTAGNYVSNDYTVIAGDKCSQGTVTRSILTSERGVLQNTLFIHSGEIQSPLFAEQRVDALISRVVVGSVTSVTIDSIEVMFDIDEDVSICGTRKIPYESIISNSFYSMPDVGDKVFVYFDNKGETVCLGSKRGDTVDEYFNDSKEKAIGALDNLIHLRKESLVLSSTRKYHSQAAQQEISVYLDKNVGVRFFSREDIRISSEKEITLASMSELAKSSKRDYTYKSDVDDTKYAVLGNYHSLAASGSKNYEPVTVIPSYGLGDIFDKESLAARGQNEKKKWVESTQSGLKNLSFGLIDIGPKSASLKELDYSLKDFTSGVSVIQAAAIQLKVGDNSIRFEYDVSLEICFDAKLFSWLGSKRVENYPVKEDELRDAWEIFLDCLGIGLAIAGLVAACVLTGGVAIAVGIGIGLAGAALTFSRGDYFGGVVAAVTSVVDGCSEFLKGIPKFMYCAMKVIYGLPSAVYSTAEMWKTQWQRMLNADSFGEGFMELLIGLGNTGVTFFSLKKDFKDLGPAYDGLPNHSVPGSGSGNTGTPGAGDGNSGTPGAGDGNSGTPGAGDGNSGTPGAGDGNSGTPGAGDGNAGTPGAGDGNSGTPGAGDGNAGTPGTGDGSSATPGSGDAPAPDTNAPSTQNGDTVGDPIDVATGALTENYTDLLLKDTNGDYKVERTYNSLYTNKNRMLGERWLFTFETSLHREGSDISIYLPDNHKEHFTLKQDDGWTNLIEGKNRYELEEHNEGYMLYDRELLESYCFNSNGFIQYTTNSYGNKTVYEYDGKLLSKITLACGSYIDFFYEDSKLIRLVDNQDREIDYEYDGELLQSVIYSNGGVRRYDYTAEGYITKVQNENGKVYLYNDFDRKGRVVHQTTSTGDEYVFFYNDSKKETVINRVQLNSTTVYRYNRNDLVECVTYEDSSTWEKKYDVNEKIIWEKDRLNNVTKRKYAGNGKIESITYSNGLEVSYSYNQDGRCTCQQDNAGQIIKYEYDENGGVSKIASEIEDGKWNEVTYNRDSYGRVLTQSYADGSRKTWTYNTLFSHPSSYRGAENEEVLYELDQYGRKAVARNMDGEITYGYNSLHLLTMLEDEEKNKTVYTYDLKGLRTSVLMPEDVIANDGRGITYKYDDADHLLSLEDEEGIVYARKVDSDGRVVKEIDPETYDAGTEDGEGTQFTYDADGNLTHTFYRDGSVKRRFYDSCGNLIKEVLPEDYNKDTDNGKGTTYKYDEMNHVSEVIDRDGVILSRYTYDYHGRVIGLSNAKLIDLSEKLGKVVETVFTYNKAGWKTTERVPVKVDEDNNVLYRLTVWDYDLKGNQTAEKRFLEYQSVSSALGKVLRINKQYDKSNRLVKVTDSIGACMEYTYDGRNRLTSERMKISDGVYNEKRYTYTKNGSLQQVSESADVKSTAHEFSTTKFLYDKNGNLVKMITPTGNEMKHSYNRANKLIRTEMAQADGKIKNISEMIYDNSSRLTEKRKDGISEKYSYDIRGRRNSVCTGNNTTAFEYNKNGQIVRIVEPRQYDRSGVNGKAKQFEYDGDKVLKITRADGFVESEYVYNSYGEVIGITEDTKKISFDYDLSGRKTEITSNSGACQYVEYDPWNHVTKSIDGNSNETGFSLDGWGKVLEVKRADGGVEAYTYDLVGNIQEAVDGQGNAVHFQYNELNRLAKRIDQEGNTEVWDYDSEGRPCHYRDRNGTEISYTYNMYGELMRKYAVNVTDAEEVFAYNEEGLLEYVIGGGMRYDYIYDDNKRRIAKKASGKTLISYEYDKYNAVISQTDMTGKKTEYKYDEFGRMLEAIDNGVSQVTYDYLASGKVQSKKSNILETSYAYDIDGNNSHIKTVLGNETLLDNYYSFDNNGNCIKKETLSGITEYTYDCMNRLEQALYPNCMERYSYDYADNRVSREFFEVYANGKYTDSNDFLPDVLEAFISKPGSIGGRYEKDIYEYTDSNRLKQVNVGVTEMKLGEDFGKEVTSTQNSTLFEYDAQGNLIKDGTAKYEYDAFNRLVQYSNDCGDTLRNKYDAEGLRYEMEENGRLVQFLYNRDKVVAEIRESEEIYRYIRGTEIISSDSEKAKVYYHYVTDELGSITDIVSAAVKKKLQENAEAVDTENVCVVNHYEYDAFGNVLRCEETIENRFRFTGEIYDSISGQYYLRARFYNPVLGRFMQEDDNYNDGLNLYAYCKNNPVKYVDPSGHTSTSPADRSTSPDPTSVSSGGTDSRETPITTGRSKPDKTSTPNSIYEQLNSDGTVKSRAFYDENGRQFCRQDFDHSHYDKQTDQYYQPHEHNYSYNENGQPNGDSSRQLPDGYTNQPTN